MPPLKNGNVITILSANSNYRSHIQQVIGMTQIRRWERIRPNQNSQQLPEMLIEVLKPYQHQNFGPGLDLGLEAERFGSVSMSGLWSWLWRSTFLFSAAVWRPTYIQYILNQSLVVVDPWTRLRLHCHIWTIPMQLGQPEPGFSNQSLAPVENGWTLV